SNKCPADLSVGAWPGGPDVQTIDDAGFYGGNMSGLTYQGSGSATPLSGVLWAGKNSPRTLYRLLWDGTKRVPAATNGLSAGEPLHYGNGTGDVDAEGVTFAADPSGGMYVSSERANGAPQNQINRFSVLRYDASSTATELSALNEWNLTSDLPPP